MKVPEVFHQVQQLFKQLGNETRLKIVWLLRSGSKNVTQIKEALNLTQPAVSQQLAQLSKHHIVTYEAVGKEKYYRLMDDHIKDVLDVAIEHMLHS